MLNIFNLKKRRERKLLYKMDYHKNQIHILTNSKMTNLFLAEELSKHIAKYNNCVRKLNELGFKFEEVSLSSE